MLKQFKDRIKKSAANRLAYRTIMTTIPASAGVEEITQAILLKDDIQRTGIKRALLKRRLGHLEFWVACATHAIN